MKITPFRYSTISLTVAMATLWGSSGSFAQEVAVTTAVTTAAPTTTAAPVALPTLLSSRFTATRTVEGDLTVNVIPATTDVGTQKAIFVIALLGNDVYVQTRTGWVRWKDDWKKIPSIDGDATTGAVPRNLTAFDATLCTACTGVLSDIRLYIGYGTNLVDMLNQYTYNEVLRLPPTVFKPDATDLQEPDSAYYSGANILNVRLKAIAGDAVTIATINTDLNSKDTFDPEMKIHFSADDYPNDGKVDNAKLRMRGESTRLAAQKSYRVKLNSGMPLWRGEQTLQFNKHPYDLTRMRNKLAMDLFRDIPHINSLRTQFAHIVFDDDANAATPDVDYGLFTHVEKMGKEYLAQRGLPTTSVMYKAEEFKFEPDERLALKSDGSPVNQTTFEYALSIQNSGNHTLLQQMLADVNNSNTDFNTVFSKYFNRNNYLTWLATSILMGNHDTRDQNFGLLQLAGTTRYYFVPWDYDGSLGWVSQADVSPNGKPYYADWQYGLSNWWESPLHRRFLQQAGHLELLKAAVDELRDKYLTPARILHKAQTYKPVIEAWVSAAPDVANLPASTATASTNQRVQEWNAEVQRLSTVIEGNYNAFIARLEKPMPFFQSATTSAGQLVLGWEPSVDLQGDAVSYTVQVASQPDLASVSSTNLKVNQTGLTITSVSVPALPAGTYYMKVVATDSKGHSQIAFDTTVDTTTTGSTKYFGVLKFVVN